MNKAVDEDVPGEHAHGEVVAREDLEVVLALLNAVHALLDLLHRHALQTPVVFPAFEECLVNLV